MPKRRAVQGNLFSPQELERLHSLDLEAWEKRLEIELQSGQRIPATLDAIRALRQLGRKGWRPKPPTP